MSRVDLHLHSTVSDGKFSPAEIVGKAAEHGLTIIAITDHDSVDGVVPALEVAKSFPGMNVISGVEISTDVPQGEIHVLGYFVNCTDREFLAALQRFRQSRLRRAQQMVAKLRNFGILIEWGRVQELAGCSSIGRPHIAQVMLEDGYISSFKEAFAKYISRGGPAYVEREKMTPGEAAELILRTNGLPVLAHPLTINNLETVVVELKAAGLVGIEVYYNGYTDDEIKRLVSLANKYDLITTGGSDYHGLDDTTETMIGGANVPIESAERLIALAEKRVLKLANQ